MADGLTTYQLPPDTTYSVIFSHPSPFDFSSVLTGATSYGTFANDIEQTYANDNLQASTPSTK